MVAELYIVHPDQAWGRVAPLLTTAFGFKPVSLAATLTQLLGIPAAYSPNVALEKPIVGVVVDGDPARVVVGIRVQGGGELIAALSTGRDPTHDARPLEGNQVTLLEPRKHPIGEAVMGICGNTLLLGAHGEDLARYGPYVARELPRRASTAGADAALPAGSFVLTVPAQGLRGPLSRRLGDAWRALEERLGRQAREQQRRHGGRPPDFAEPTAVIAALDRQVEQLVALVGDARALTVVVEPRGERVDVEVRLLAGPGGKVRRAIDALPTATTTPLLDLPLSTSVAVSLGSTAAGRVESANALTAGLAGVFGARLSSTDRGRLEEAWGALARGRGDALAVGAVVTEGGPALVLEADVADAEALGRGVPALLRTLELPVLADPLAATLGRPRVALDAVSLPGIEPRVQRGRVTWGAPGTAGTPAVTTPVLWVVIDDRLHLAAGEAAPSALGALVTAGRDEAVSLAADAACVAALGRTEKNAAVLVFARPAALGIASTSEQPLVVSLGGAQDALVVKGELDHATVLTIARQLLRSRP